MPTLATETTSDTPAGKAVRVQISCTRCTRYFNLPQSGDGWEDLQGGVRRHTASGITVTPNNCHYCASCGPVVRFCHGCGCTDEAGCLPHSCYWVGPNECSACSQKSTEAGNQAGNQGGTHAR